MKSNQCPTLKLGIAFGGMCCMMLAMSCREMLLSHWGWLDWLMACLKIGVGAWITWFGIFKTATLQLMWGWACLAVGSVILITLAGWVLFDRASFPKGPVPLVLLGNSGMVVTGWLLIADRDVRRYRVYLRKLENERCKLRLED